MESERRRRVVHAIVAATAIGWAVAHALTVFAARHEIHPFTGLGWMREHLLGALILGTLGAAGLALRRRPRARIVVALALGVVALAICTRWLSTSVGLVATLGFLDGAHLARRRWAQVVWAGATVGVGLFALGTSARPGALPSSARPRSVTAGAPAAIGVSCDDARARVGKWTLEPAFATELEALRPPLQPVYCRLIVENLAAKEAAGLDLLTLDIKSRVLQFERFRLETTLSAGVTPKRYFGFLDETGDTAAYETALRETVIAAVVLANDEAARRGAATRISEKEVAVTFLAEGGALVLGDRLEDIEAIHPVTGIGLDDFRKGFAKHRALVDALDQKLGTGLGSLTTSIAGTEILRRPMTFKEAICGTTIMYLDEKELTARLLRERDGETGARLETRPLDRQFVVSSLVYNSGILFSDERVDQILAFSTGDYLAGVNEANRGKRPTLALFAPAELEARLVAGEPLPTQRTSWSAVYHVLQRYGAWVALARFTDLFDDEGRFRKRSG